MGWYRDFSFLWDLASVICIFILATIPMTSNQCFKEKKIFVYYRFCWLATLFIVMTSASIFYGVNSLQIIIWSLVLSAMVIGPAIYQYNTQPEIFQHFKPIKPWAIPCTLTTIIFISACFLIAQEELIVGIFVAYFTYPLVLIIYASRNIIKGISLEYWQHSFFVSGIVSGFFPCLLACLIVYGTYFYLRDDGFSDFSQKYSFQFFITFVIDILFFSASPTRATHITDGSLKN